MGHEMTSGLSLRLAPCFVFALALVACVEDVDPVPSDVSQAGSSSGGTGNTAAAGSGGGGNNTAGNNTAGTGGANSYQSDPTFAMGVHCPAVTQALIIDFSPPAPPAPPAVVADAAAPADAAPPVAAAPATGATFGDFTTTLSGSTFVYPGAGTMYPVTSDVSGSNWHLTGTIGDYSGFGISFNNCYLVDASAYQGISFTVQGSVPMGNTVTLNVGTAADDPSHVWLNANANPVTPLVPNAGRCIPAASQYDGTCGSPNFVVPVTAEPTTVNVTWAQLTGGRPAATTNPAEITNISWNFPPPVGAGTATPTTYAADITIDDLRFIGP
jgi:hypothetical protein